MSVSIHSRTRWDASFRPEARPPPPGGRPAPSGHAVDVVLDEQAGQDVTFTDEHRLVHPGVAGVAGLQAGVRAEVVVLEVGRRPGADGGHGRLVELEKAEVL